MYQQYCKPREEITRKRKLDSMEEDSRRSDNCTRESDDSNTASNQAGDVGNQGLFCHKHKVRIKETDLLPGCSGNCDTSPVNMQCEWRATHEFNCLHKGPTQTKETDHRPPSPMEVQEAVTTGDIFTDKVVDSLKGQGYAMLAELHRGNFASLLKAYSENLKKKVVLKFLLKNEKSKSRKPTNEIIAHPWECQSNDEVFITDRLKHRNIVEMFEYYCIAGRLCLVLEHCENSDLEKIISATRSNLLTEAVSKKYFSQMVEGLSYLHGYDIVHRNVTARHFILNTYDVIKLCDFGMARKVSPEGTARYKEVCGAPGHLAPELLVDQPCYDPKPVDRFALGVILFRMMTGKLPFPQDSREARREMRKGVNFSAVPSVHLSCSAQELISGLLHSMVSVRFTFNKARQSEWLLEAGEKPKFAIGNRHLIVKT